MMTEDQKIQLMILMRNYTFDAMDFAVEHKGKLEIAVRHTADESFKALMDYVQSL